MSETLNHTGKLPVTASSGKASAGLGAEPIGRDPSASNSGSVITARGVPPNAVASGSSNRSSGVPVVPAVPGSIGSVGCSGFSSGVSDSPSVCVSGFSLLSGVSGFSGLSEGGVV